MDLARLPHGPPVRLVERLLRASASEAKAELTVRQGPWLRRGFFAEEALVEALAQTCGLLRRESDAREGALAAVTRFSFPSRARPGETVTLSVRLEAMLGPLAAFEGVARVGSREVARGELRVALT